MNGILTAFNNHFGEFIEDIQTTFPENLDIATAKKSIELLRKANPKILIKMWSLHVADPYKTQIEAGNISFFLEKDYAEDVSDTDNSVKIMESIDRLRNPIKEMGHDNQQKSMKYIQNLSKLAAVYNGS